MTTSEAKRAPLGWAGKGPGWYLLMLFHGGIEFLREVV